MRNNNGAVVRKLTHRSLGANKKRNFFVVAAIALTAFMMASVFSVGMSLIESLNISRFRAEGTLAHMGFIGNEEHTNALAELEYVRYFGRATNIGYANLPGFDGAVLMMHTDRSIWEHFTSPTFSNIVGRYAESGNEIMLSRYKLAQMGIDNPYIGMEITFDFTITGALENVLTETFTLSAIYTEFVSVHGNATTPIFVSHDFLLRHEPSQSRCNNVQVIFQNRARAMEYAERLAHDLNLGEDWIFGVHPAILFASNINHTGVYIGMGTIIAFLMLTGFLLIYNVMYISVSKDVRFYGLLKTLGTTPRQLRRIINIQVVWMYIIGLPIGLVIAAVASLVIIPAFAIGITTGAVISFSPLIYIGGAVFTFLTAYLGAFTSAKKAARVSPVEAIRYAGEQSTRTKVRISAKGKVSRMAFRNVFRERKRALVVLSSLFLGITVFTIIMSIVNSIDADYMAKERFDHDFSIANADFMPLHSGIADQVAAIPGVEAVRLDFVTMGTVAYGSHISRYVDMHIDVQSRFDVLLQINRENIMANGLDFTIRGIDTAWFMEWNAQQETPLTPAEVEAFLHGDLILFDESQFRWQHRLSDYEIHQLFPIGTMFDIEIGIDELDERVPIRTMLGGFANFRPNVGGSISFGFASSTNIFMSAEYLQNLLGEDLRLMTINFNVTSGQDENVYNALHTMFGTTITFASRHELRLQFAEERQTMLVLGVGLSAILGIIGIFNFINVISVGLLVRKRELAALESVGMQKRQMRAMLRWEGAIYWMITLAASLTIGNGIAYGLFRLISEAGSFPTFAYPLVPIAVAYAIIIFICSVTPEIAYKSISKLTLVERLREVE